MDWYARVRDALPTITGDVERDRAIHAELADHAAERYDDLRAQGHPAADAEREALREIAEAAASRRVLTTAVRPRRSVRPVRTAMRLLSELRHDVAHGVRLLVRSPGAPLVAILTMTLAIGATAGLFSVVRAVLLKPLPYPSPDRLVRIWEVTPRGDIRNPVSPGNYHDWRERASMFEAIGATTSPIDMAVTGDGEPLKIEAARMTPSLVRALAVMPLLGRAFTEEEGDANAPAVALLAHGFWQRRFGGHPGVLGRAMYLDDRPFTIVGVLPPAFAFPSSAVDVVTNLRFGAEDRAERRSHNYHVVARLKPNVTPREADAAMDAIAAQLAREYPEHMSGWSVNLVGVHEDDVRDVRPLLMLLSGVVAAVLLIACSNLANLQLVRAERRSQELAVRAAIGAGRGRLFRQVLTESCLTVLAGGAAGIALGAALVRVIAARAPRDIPMIDRVSLDAWVLAASIGVTIACALLVGLAPAVRVVRAELRPVLQAARVRTDGSHRRLRQGLVIAQVALALVLVVCAGLLARSFWNLNRVEHGFDATGVLTVALDLPRARYPDGPAQLVFYEELLERLRAVPGVAAAGGSTGSLGSGSGMTFSFAIEGRPSPNPSGREDPVPLQGVTPGYFDTMRIAVLAGRGFTHADRGDARPVVLVNETLARRHWPNGGAVGARINFRPGLMPWREIVGIVADTRDRGPAEPPAPTIYVPFAQREASWAWMTWQTIVVRAATGSPVDLVPDVRNAVWAVDRNLPLLEVSTAVADLAEAEARRRTAAALLGAFAILALVLGAIGVYGVMSCTVAEQQQEIGIRLALGAEPSGIARRVVIRALSFSGIGVAIGLVAAAAATRALGTLLYEVPPVDPVTFASVSVLLLAVSGVAAWLPARRAMQVDPISILRNG